MKVICNMVVTPNGYIAYDDRKSISLQYDWDDFSNGAKEFNNFVVGRKTLDIVGRGFKSVKCDYRVVVSSKGERITETSFIHAYSPEDVISKLSGKVNTIFLVGGGEINTAFMKKGFIDELRLIIVPQLTGKGINLFSPTDFKLALRLKKVEERLGGRVKITYSVIH